MSVGRKQDLIWDSFQEIKINGKIRRKAKCKLCGHVLQRIVSRMKTHQKICTMDENNDLLMKEENTRKIQLKETFSGTKICNGYKLLDFSLLSIFIGEA